MRYYFEHSIKNGMSIVSIIACWTNGAQLVLYPCSLSDAKERIPNGNKLFLRKTTVRE